MRKSSLPVLVLAVLTAGFAAAAAQQVVRPAGWSEATHGSGMRPDYGQLFSMDRVHELRITIPADRFAAMQEDLKTIAPAGMGRGGFPGARGGAGGALPGGFPDPAAMAAMVEASAAACTDKPPAAACTTNGAVGQCTEMPFGGGGRVCLPAELAAGMRGGGAPNLTARDPIYVPVTVTHEGRVWTQVGMRYKGNSSLMMSNATGNGKVPFRLDFDRYEDEVPATRNQRFYGFQELTFSSNFGDDSQLREVLASEILRDRGVPAPRAAFYRIWVDAGKGPEYWGLYTMIEDPADGAMLALQFGSDEGNLYKPDGPGANWSRFDRAGFEKKTNERAADYTDVEGAIRALHAPRDDPRAWRAALEARFDVDHFLRWLAVNTVIENWDAYGVMAHNYYLYGDPARRGQLRWIPWDHNFAFGAQPFPGGRGGRGFAGAPLPPFPPRRGGAAQPGPMLAAFGGGGDVLHRQVNDNWPLVRRLLADDVYASRYRALLKEATVGLAAPAAFEPRARALHEMIAPAVAAERPTHTTVSSRDAFARALDGPDGLTARLRGRIETVAAALAETARQ
jgi:hypothetical protein